MYPVYTNVVLPPPDPNSLFPEDHQLTFVRSDSSTRIEHKHVLFRTRFPSPVKKPDCFEFYSDWRRFVKISTFLYSISRPEGKYFLSKACEEDAERYKGLLHTTPMPIGSKVFISKESGMTTKALKEGSKKNGWIKVADPTEADYFVLSKLTVNYLIKESIIFPGDIVRDKPIPGLSELESYFTSEYSEFASIETYGRNYGYLPFVKSSLENILLNIPYSINDSRFDWRTGVLLPRKDAIYQLLTDLDRVFSKIENGSIKVIIGNIYGVDTGLIGKDSELEFTDELKENLFSIFSNNDPSSEDVSVALKIFTSLKPTEEVALHFGICCRVSYLNYYSHYSDLTKKLSTVEFTPIKQALSSRSISWMHATDIFIRSMFVNREGYNKYLKDNPYFKKILYAFTVQVLSGNHGINEEVLKDHGILAY